MHPLGVTVVVVVGIGIADKLTCKLWFCAMEHGVSEVEVVRLS